MAMFLLYLLVIQFAIEYLDRIPYFGSFSDDSKGVEQVANVPLSVAGFRILLIGFSTFEDSPSTEELALSEESASKIWISALSSFLRTMSKVRWMGGHVDGPAGTLSCIYVLTRSKTINCMYQASKNIKYQSIWTKLDSATKSNRWIWAPWLDFSRLITYPSHPVLWKESSPIFVEIVTANDFHPSKNIIRKFEYSR